VFDKILFAVATMCTHHAASGRKGWGMCHAAVVLPVLFVFALKQAETFVA
jgi:hypothetical protein